ncbi:MAG TPA: serine protease, partial [Gammaproteobacteria bacterium]|nr:serine protease [Gammaproteobacteria bacterium]
NIRSPRVNFNGKDHPGYVLFINQSKDFAMLEVSTDGQYVVPLRQQPLAETDTVWAVGFPMGGGQVVNQGEYEGLIEDGTLHTTASVDHGQSGGGLISCENGHHVLAGMTTGFGAIRAGGEVIRLDDYSVALSSMDIEPLMGSDQHQAVAYVDTREEPVVTEPYYEEYIPEATLAGYSDEPIDSVAMSKLGSAEYYPYLYYEEHP